MSHVEHLITASTNGRGLSCIAATRVRRGSSHPDRTRLGVSTSKVVAALAALSPTAFEHCAFDLTVEAGLRNAAWRTPGPDAGRDIDGDYTVVDYSGQRTTQRWYVECKRYARAIDWPTVWKKVAYADNSGAHFLLLVTTSTLSPTCQTEVSKWNVSGRAPQIRFWDAARLERLLLRYPAVSAKYGLPGAAVDVPRSLMTLAEAAVKATQAAYGSAVLADSVGSALETAAAIGELLVVRMRTAQESRRFSVAPYVLSEDGYPWLTAVDGLVHFDRYGMRAILAFVRQCTGTPSLDLATADGGEAITARLAKPLEASAGQLLFHLCTWAHCEVHMTDTELTFRPRKDDD